jgi:hypothetical protein
MVEHSVSTDGGESSYFEMPEHLSQGVSQENVRRSQSPVRYSQSCESAVFGTPELRNER